MYSCDTIFYFFLYFIRVMNEANHYTTEMLMRICLEIVELTESYKSNPTSDIQERIKLKEQLLKELTEFFKSIPPGHK